MNLRFVLKLCGLALVSATAAHGQISSTLKLTKTQYVAGETVMATVTMTNNAGRELVLRGDERHPWLDFMVRNNTGDPSIPLSRVNFNPVIIQAGQTMTREVNLSTFVNTAEMGSFSVYAVIHSPGENSEDSTTNRVLFNITGARTYWKQTVGVKGDSTKTREYRVLSYAGDQKTELYVQVLDGRTGMPINTFSLGAALMFQKPQIAVDGNQVLHVMYLASPVLWLHAWVDTSGKLLGRELYQRPATGDPTMVSNANGSVAITNGNLYDPRLEEEAQAKIRKISERPSIQQK